MTAVAARGAQAEQTAAAFLRGRGLRILARNYRAPGGEIDLIAEDAGTLAFVEVRMRSGTRHGGALESIDRHKRRRILRAARHYLACRSGAEPPCRFDAVLLTRVTHQGRQSFAVEWLRDAFSVDDC
jgi:putative endonuclease